MSRSRVLVAAALAAVAAALVTWAAARRGARDVPAPSLPPIPPAEVGRVAVAAWRGETPPPSPALAEASHGAYVAARAGGRLLEHGWADGGSAAEALATAARSMRRRLGDRAEGADTLEVFLARARTPIDPERERAALADNIHRGVRGVELAVAGGEPVRVSPTYIVANNLELDDVLKLFRQSSLERRQADPGDIAHAVLFGDQFLVRLGDGSTAAMERGNTVVDLADVTRGRVQRFADLAGSYLANGLLAHGRMTYLYWPSVGGEAKGRNNLIRQWMATIALGRVARATGDAALDQRVAENIDYNLRTFFRQEGELGAVELYGKVKLGAVALAALAIVEHPERERWRAQEEALVRTTLHLHQPGGAFRTFLKPADRNDNHNFYPGEALLLWATLYRDEPDPALRERFDASVAHYQRWHADNRNPAFVPWHTMAYASMWEATRDPRLVEHVFAMNDWLLGVQQWDDAPTADTRGRFYAPDRPFGPPHASSTGVYLEGLIAAYRLARAVGDDARAEAYRTAIRRGLRSILQLQFDDDVDLFYVADTARVRGGVRTTVYDNQIRCDNVQHPLMAVLDILESDVLD